MSYLGVAYQSNLPGVFVETNTYPKSSRKEEENDEIPEYQESRA